MAADLTDAHRVLISILAAEAVEQFLAEGSDPMTKTNCAQEHFCARCGWELKLERRVPSGTGFLCPRCARKKGRSRPSIQAEEAT